MNREAYEAAKAKLEGVLHDTNVDACEMVEILNVVSDCVEAERVRCAKLVERAQAQYARMAKEEPWISDKHEGAADACEELVEEIRK